MSARKAVNVIGAVLVLGAAAVLIVNAISTSSARVAATTEGQSFFAAGTVVLSQPDAAVEMLFDADGLYPGVEVEGCVGVEYSGSVPASIRVHADRTGGSGLDAYVDLRLSVIADGEADPCATAEPTTFDSGVVYDGRLQTLWTRHGDYDSGVVLVDAARPGQWIALRAVASVADDNRAQGLTTDFSITIEARP